MIFSVNSLPYHEKACKAHRNSTQRGLRKFRICRILKSGKIRTEKEKMRMNAEKIGGLIYRLRKEKHLTQAQLAEKLHITDKTVSKWKRAGERLILLCLQNFPPCSGWIWKNCSRDFGSEPNGHWQYAKNAVLCMPCLREFDCICVGYLCFLLRKEVESPASAKSGSTRQTQCRDYRKRILHFLCARNAKVALYFVCCFFDR